MGFTITPIDKESFYKDLQFDMKLISEVTVERNENLPWHLSGENGNEPIDYLLLLTKQAVEDIFTFICWNDHKTSRNRNEQGGILAGRYYIHPMTRKKMCYIVKAFPMPDAASTPKFLDAKALDWAKAAIEMEQYNIAHNDCLMAVGWFHTHPNRLPVFMSEIDLETQRKTCSDEDRYAIVLNPHTTRWKAFRSGDAVDAYCCMLDIDDINLLVDKSVAYVETPTANMEAPTADTETPTVDSEVSAEDVVYACDNKNDAAEHVRAHYSGLVHKTRLNKQSLKKRRCCCLKKNRSQSGMIKRRNRTIQTQDIGENVEHGNNSADRGINMNTDKKSSHTQCTESQDDDSHAGISQQRSSSRTLSENIKLFFSRISALLGIRKH